MPSSLLRASNLFTEGFLLLFVLSFINFCFLLDEPFLDLSDWSVVHILCLFVGLISILSENKLRASFGQYGPKDLSVMQAILSFWLTLERYTVLIIIFSGIHFLLPLEGELFALIEIHLYLLAWVSSSVLPVLVASLIVFYLAYTLNLALAWARWGLIVFLLTLLILILLISWLCLFYDLALNSLSAWTSTLDVAVFYQQPQVTSVHTSWLGSAGIFDWHDSSSRPRTMRFEELGTFFISIFALFVLGVTLFWWAYIGLFFLYGAPLQLSYGAVGIGLRLLDHFFFSLACGFFGLGLVSLRILLRLPGDYLF